MNNHLHGFVLMKPPNKESTFSKVDGFEDGVMSDISEEASECESDSEEEEDVNWPPFKTGLIQQ